jgi:drug/metabolite transporter (DMT)-like permease
MRALLAIGALDISANALFAAASTEGLVSLVAVLASLYPVVTILLARVVLGEHVRRVQQAGIASVLAGVALISAG